MISGNLSASRERAFRNAFLVPVALLALLAITGLVPSRHPSRRYPGPAVLILLGTIPAMMFYFLAQNRRRAVSHFEYDGATLRYETLSHPHSRSFSRDQLHDIQPMPSRGGYGGYVLIFRTGARLNIDFEVEHCRGLIDQLNQDRWPDQSPTL